MKSSPGRGCGVAILAAVAVLGTAATAHAQGAFSRQGQWDVYGLVGWQDTEDTTLKAAPGIDVSFDDDMVFGFGGAYHFTPQLDIGFELSLGEVDAAASDQITFLRQEVDFSNFEVSLEWNMLKGPFTPVIAAGAGFTSFSTAIPGADPVPICISNPFIWWCTVGVPTYADTEFSYSVGAGLRWDSPRGWYVKLMADNRWVDVSNLDDPQFLTVTLQIGGAMRSWY